MKTYYTALDLAEKMDVSLKTVSVTLRDAPYTMILGGSGRKVRAYKIDTLPPEWRNTCLGISPPRSKTVYLDSDTLADIEAADDAVIADARIRADFVRLCKKFCTDRGYRLRRKAKRTKKGELDFLRECRTGSLLPDYIRDCFTVPSWSTLNRWMLKYDELGVAGLIDRAVLKKVLKDKPTSDSSPASGEQVEEEDTKNRKKWALNPPEGSSVYSRLRALYDRQLRYMEELHPEKITPSKADAFAKIGAAIEKQEKLEELLSRINSGGKDVDGKKMTVDPEVIKNIREQFGL